MKKYEVIFYESALEDIAKHRKSGQKTLLKKIDDLITELEDHPSTGTGKPELLKGRNMEMSRRINNQHRLTYFIDEENKIVEVLSAYGHYDDK